jgi:hypothetical protein
MRHRPSVQARDWSPRPRSWPIQRRDADTWHHGVNRPLQTQRRWRYHRVMWRDLQSPAFDPDAGKSIAFQGAVHLAKTFRQRDAAISQPRPWICLEASVPHGGFSFVSRHEIAVEPTILTATIDPDIPGAQSVSQGGDNGGLVLSRLRSGLPTHLCGLSLKCQGAFAA